MKKQSQLSIIFFDPSKTVLDELTDLTD